MKPKTTIRLITKGKHAGEWKASRPTVGFSPRLNDVERFETWPQAIKWATDRTHGGSCHIEQAMEDSDGIAPRPRWSATEGL